MSDEGRDPKRWRPNWAMYLFLWGILFWPVAAMQSPRGENLIGSVLTSGVLAAVLWARWRWEWS